jgi:hypothetical protein
MARGQDCVRCHDGAAATRWTAAGTWTRGATVTLTDASGKTVTLRGNSVGNFYTAEPLAYPLAASVDGRTMSEPVTYGGCNRCHDGGDLTTGDELMAPGEDCLACHDGSGAKRFTVAGTFAPQGRVVTIRDAAGVTVTLTTNRVGNFFTTKALAFPLTVSVGGDRMPDRVTYGGCNTCHGADADDD